MKKKLLKKKKIHTASRRHQHETKKDVKRKKIQGGNMYSPVQFLLCCCFFLNYLFKSINDKMQVSFGPITFFFSLRKDVLQPKARPVIEAMLRRDDANQLVRSVMSFLQAAFNQNQHKDQGQRMNIISKAKDKRRGQRKLTEEK